jgi:hypothetical protein
MKIAEKHSDDVSELMEPTGIFWRLIMFMIDLLDFMGLLNCM